MARKILYCCIFYVSFFITFCDLCKSKGSKPSPMEGLYVYKGNLSKLVQKNASTLILKDGDQIEYSCYQNYTSGSVQLYWIQEKDNRPIFYGNVTTNKDSASRIQMSVIKLLDNNSTISCVALRDNKIKGRHSIFLHFNESASSSSYLSPNTTFLSKGEHFEKYCSRDKDRMLAVYKNHTVTSNQFNYFNVTEEHEGMILICVHKSISKPQGADVSVRNVYNLTELKINEFKPSIITDNSTSPPSPLRTLPEQPIVIGTGVVIMLVVLLLCTLYIRKNRKTEAHRTVQQTEHSEPVHASPNQVIYAELQLAHDNRLQNNISYRNENPYAEVIGVLTPREPDQKTKKN